MPAGWLSWSAIVPDVWVGPKTSFTLWSSLFSPYSKGSPAVIAGITGVYLSRVTWWPTVHSGCWLPAPNGCLDQTCYLWWSVPELCAVYNSPLQTWCQSYIWWLWPAALHKISRTCQESIKESQQASWWMEACLLQLHRQISWAMWRTKVVSYPSPDECWNRCPISKIRCWFHDHISSTKCVG